MNKTAALLMALGLALPALTLAQDNRDGDDARPPRRDGPPPREMRGREARDGDRDEARGPARDRFQSRRGARGDGERPGGPDGLRRMPPPPLVGALDANRDGVIDEAEIRHAPEALRKLDKNDDGKLTLDELRPGPGGGPRAGMGPGRGEQLRRGPRGEGPRDGQGPRREMRREHRGDGPQADRESDERPGRRGPDDR